MVNFTIQELDLIEALANEQEQSYTDAEQEDDDCSGFEHIEGITCVADARIVLENVVARIHGGKIRQLPARCPDCGEEGEPRGHMGCQYPSDDPDGGGLDDPMARER